MNASLLRRIALPEPFERRRQRLSDGRLINMFGIAGEQELIVVALVGQHLGETLVRQDPIVHAIRHRSDRIKEIVVPSLEPNADRLRRAVRNQRRAEMRIALRNFAALDAEISDRRPRPGAVIFPGAPAARDYAAIAGSPRLANKSARGGKARGETRPS